MWHGAARTNMARFAAVDKLEELVKGAGVVVTRGKENFAMLRPGETSDDGDFPTFLQGEDGEELELFDAVAQLLEPDSVLVLQRSGADALRTLSGSATAYVRRADGTVESADVSISDIYQVAAARFGIPTDYIGEVLYETLPKRIERITARPTERGG